MKVLHIVENLNRGAVESWLMRMLRHARSRGIAVNWSFYCSLGEPGEMDEEASALGACVVHSPVSIGRTANFVAALRGEYRRGQYEVLHCHHDLLSAVYLLAALGMPIRRRVVHVHNADEALPTPNRLKQYLYREPMRRTCFALSDRIAGISNHTLDTFLAGRPRRLERDIVHYYGVDPARFENAIADRAAFRRQLGLSENTLILLFAGRMVAEKNPLFAVDVLTELRRIEPRTVAVFAGTGLQQEAVRARAREHGVEEHVYLLGWRNDLPEIMSCCDWFILPHPEHPMEGFGLAVVEAQLAGLRMLLSHGIPDDPLLPTAVFRRLALAPGPKVWAQAAADLVGGSPPSRLAALAALQESMMNMDRALDGLMRLHA